MNTNRVKLDQLPEWDFSIEIKGRVIQMISPLVAPDMNESPLPSQAQIDEQLKRWPGVFVWLWRALAGNPRIKRESLPTDGGAEFIRKQCEVILCNIHDDLVRELSTGECLQIVATYQACQQEWIAAASRNVSAQAYEHMRKNSTQEESAGTPSGFEPMVPGKVQFSNSYHPMLRGDSQAS